MTTPKYFPIDFSSEEITQILSDLHDKLDTQFLSEGEKLSIERKIVTCQNQLLFLSLMDSNANLSSQQSTLIQQQDTLSKLFLESTKANKRTAREAKIVIILTILTLLLTLALDWHHMSKVYKKQDKIIEHLESIIKISEGPVSNFKDNVERNYANDSIKLKHGIQKQITNP